MDLSDWNIVAKIDDTFSSPKYIILINYHSILDELINAHNDYASRMDQISSFTQNKIREKT